MTSQSRWSSRSILMMSLRPSLILYMTRVQRERFFNEEDYLRLKDSYILTPEKLPSLPLVTFLRMATEQSRSPRPKIW